MKDALDLFFELSSDNRFQIIKALQEKPSKLIELSNRIELPNQEVSRQLVRLTNLDLCHRDSKGFFLLTPYAEYVLTLFPGYDFLSKNRVYFRNHVMSLIPLEFQLRIGELVSSIPIPDPITNQYEVQQTLIGAEKFILTIAEQGNLINGKLVENAIRKGVTNRIMLPVNLVPSEAYVNYMRSFGIDHPFRSILADRRYLDKIPLGLIMNEKEVPVIYFPTIEGNLDYTGFKAKDSIALKWCSDLFEYFWSNGVRTPPRLVELFGWG
jgi:predicted transcriptional regulator